MYYTYTITRGHECKVIIAGRVYNATIMSVKPHPVSADVFSLAIHINGVGIHEYWMRLVSLKKFEFLASNCKVRTNSDAKKKYVLQKNILGFKKGDTSNTLDRDGRVLFRNSNGTSISLKIDSKFITEDAGR